MLSQSPECSVHPLSLGRAPLVGRGLCSSLLVLLALGAVQAGAAMTITVPTQCSLTDAIDAANLQKEAYEVDVDGPCPSGNYSGTNTIQLSENITLTSSPSIITSSLILDGMGNPENYFISGNDLVQILRVNNPIKTLIIKDITLKNGRGNNGGAVNIFAGTVTVNRVKFTANQSNAGTPGGAIYNAGGTLNITDSVFYGNRAINSFGGAISNDSFSLTTTIQTSAFQNNSADVSGGAISTGGGTLIVNTSEFNANNVSGINVDNKGQGGAIAIGGEGIATIISNTFDQNKAYAGNSSSGTARGGAIHLSSTKNIQITSNTFSGNEAKADAPIANPNGLGGAIYVKDIGTKTIRYNTFINNKALATTTAQGGAIYNESIASQTLNLQGNIISSNQSLPSDGKEFYRSSTTVGSFNKSYNFLGDSSDSSGIATAFVNYGSTSLNDINATSDGQNIPLTSILNTTLNYNGGPTRTHALVVNSPAIDTIPGGATSPPCSSTSTKTQDQRGFYRANGNANDVTNTPYTGYPIGNTTPPQSGYGNINCDMGAYEFAAKPTKKGDITYTSSRISGPTIIGTGPRYSIEYRIRSTNVSSGSLRNVVYKLNTVCFLNKSTNPYTCLSGTDGFLVDDGGTSHGPGWAVSIPDSTFTGNTFDNGEVFDTTIKLSISDKSGTLRYIVDFYADPAARETLAVSDHQPQFLESMTFDVDLDEPAAIPKRTLASQESTTSSEISHESSDDLMRAYK